MYIHVVESDKGLPLFLIDSNWFKFYFASFPFSGIRILENDWLHGFSNIYLYIYTDRVWCHDRYKRLFSFLLPLTDNSYYKINISKEKQRQEVDEQPFMLIYCMLVWLCNNKPHLISFFFCFTNLLCVL